MTARKPNQRQAFSIVELLVVIAIIAVLVMLLFGGLQKSREAANRVACMNNMRQVGAAFHGYHLREGYFPTEKGTDKSFYRQILADVEQKDAASGTQISLFLCPSRRASNAGAKRDYGYAASGSTGSQGPSVLDTDGAASLQTISSYNGAQNIVMLTHV